MSRKIISAKEYNARDENRIHLAVTDKGEIRQTGYVLVDTETDVRLWFPNMGQAKIERDTPGKYGKRGEVL